MILLVEDDATSRYAFARLLRGQGYEVIEAGDGNDAVTLLDGLPVDLVITDMALSESHSRQMACYSDSSHVKLSF
jgi:CheY-like chemotaxis protein